MKIDRIIEAYIESKRNAWSPTTLKSEKARLSNFFLKTSNKTWVSSEDAWKSLVNLAPYSRVTTWTRLVDFYDWTLENDLAETKAPNPYKRWRRENQRLFKNTYQRQVPEVSFDQARSLVDSITDESIRNRAKLLLYGGLRYFECDSFSDSHVIGKGSKRRAVFVKPSGPIYSGPYKAFWSALREVGLKPHMLRKLFATECHRNGLDHFDLCEVMGWASIETARSYVAPKKKEELARIIEGVVR